MEGSTLQCLPYEIRLEIYEHLFQDSHCNIQIYKGHHHVARAYSHASPLSLLLTNKALSAEIQGALYRFTTFHVQVHLRQVPLVERHPQELASHTHGVERPQDNGSELNLPLALRKFLWHAQRLDLSIWMSESSTSEEMAKQIEAFKSALGYGRELSALHLRLRLRPRWMEDDEIGVQARGAADELASRLEGIKCRRKKGLLIDGDALRMFSEACLARVSSTCVP